MDKTLLKDFIDKLNAEIVLKQQELKFMEKHNVTHDANICRAKIQTANKIVDELDALYIGENVNQCNFNL